MQVERTDKTQIPVQGVVTRVLYDGERKRILDLVRELETFSPKTLEALDMWARKQTFKANLLWAIVHKITKLDLKIPFLFGKWTKEAVSQNTITTKGKELMAKRIAGLTADPVGYMAIGTGTPSATALGAEITTGGGQRSAVTPTNVTTDTTNDTAQFVVQYDFTAGFAVTEEGLLDAVSGGNMYASQSFSAINVVSGDALQYTHKLKVA